MKLQSSIFDPLSVELKLRIRLSPPLLVTKDADSTIPSNGLPIGVADGVELEFHLPVKEPSSSSNKESDHSGVLRTLSMAESIGSVASKKALFELHNFVVGKHPEFDFSDFIVDFNALTPLTPDEDDGFLAPTDGGSNMEVDTSEAVDRVGDDI
ncbi:hypothetical protein NE237_011646 [Protea cynaroides]|uniref:Uncharacterized protein n=1 Tax=Protea cynaroides TaxID=273540 RepID=A0A9Q0GYA4_9MAGN|nr:hypothetical protein NE237_011646 [Protea cynaroides]